MSSELEKVAEIQYKIDHLEWNSEKIGHARAFAITSCVIWLRQTTTYFHYPAFYLIHHSLELLLKTVFNINLNNTRSHYLMNLFNELGAEDQKQFTRRDLELFKRSDELNADKGQLRYYESPHKQFSPSDFSGLVSIAHRLIKENSKVA